MPSPVASSRPALTTIQSPNHSVWMYTKRIEPAKSVIALAARSSRSRRAQASRMGGGSVAMCWRGHSAARRSASSSLTVSKAGTLQPSGIGWYRCRVPLRAALRFGAPDQLAGAVQRDAQVTGVRIVRPIRFVDTRGDVSAGGVRLDRTRLGAELEV